jgi:hypothetical protein
VNLILANLSPVPPSHVSASLSLEPETAGASMVVLAPSQVSHISQHELAANNFMETMLEGLSYVSIKMPPCPADFWQEQGGKVLVRVWDERFKSLGAKVEFEYNA